MVIRAIVSAIVMVIAAISGIWGALALWYQCPGGVTARWVASIAWVAIVLALLVLAWVRRSGWPLLAYGLAFLTLLAWWTTIRPSNTRQWADDVSQMLTGDIAGNVVTLHNVRNFNWRSEDDYDARWETRRYDLDTLSSADLVLSSWGMPGISHALVSFGFDDGSHVVFSVEIRRQRGESFSSIGGFFKQYERTIVAADEHDIVRVRTNVRNEQDQLYRLQLRKPMLRSLFLAYVGEANQLITTPAFYNTVSSNCVTIVYGMAKQIDPGLPFDYRLLLTAYLPGYLYEVGALDKRYPLAELTARGDITARARATAPNDDFSHAIRTPPEPDN